MVINATNKEAHQAHLKATWKRIGLDLAAKGLSDKDVKKMAQDIDIHDNEIRGWTFEVHLTKGRTSLIYSLKNKDDAIMLCNGASLTSVGEVS